MSDWSQGYPTHSGYIDAMQTEISPFRWRPALLTARRLPPDETSAFRFMDLGCGSGLTLIALAACYPRAQFFGYDFMPEHVVRANRMIEEAGLENVTVEEASFGDLAARDPGEKFDYASLHGVWTWVPPEVQQEIVDLLAAWMKPGGVAYFGYNAAAGWAVAEPLRQLFKEVPQARGPRPYARAREAIADLAGLIDAPTFGPLWEKLEKSPDGFLSHELASPNGHGIWQRELAAALDRAKMEYACPALLGEQFDPLFLSDEGTAYLRRAIDEGWGETARDLLHMRTFRADLYHRGAPKLAGYDMLARMSDLRVGLWRPSLRLGDYQTALGRPERGVDPVVLERLREALGDEVGTSATMGDCIDALGVDKVKAVQALMVALFQCDLIEMRPEAEVDASRETCARFNRMARRRLEDGHAMLPCLASPVLGACVPLSEERQKIAAGEQEGEAELLRGMEALGLTDI